MHCSQVICCGFLLLSLWFDGGIQAQLAHHLVHGFIAADSICGRIVIPDIVPSVLFIAIIFVGIYFDVLENVQVRSLCCRYGWRGLCHDWTVADIRGAVAVSNLGIVFGATDSVFLTPSAGNANRLLLLVKVFTILILFEILIIFIVDVVAHFAVFTEPVTVKGLAPHTLIQRMIFDASQIPFVVRKQTSFAVRADGSRKHCATHGRLVFDAPLLGFVPHSVVSILALMGNMEWT